MPQEKNVNFNIEDLLLLHQNQSQKITLENEERKKEFKDQSKRIMQQIQNNKKFFSDSIFAFTRMKTIS